MKRVDRANGDELALEIGLLDIVKAVTTSLVFNRVEKKLELQNLLCFR